MDSIISYVKKRVTPKQYYEWYFEKEYHMKTTEPRERCPWRNDKNPSLHFNLETGAWFDHGSKNETGSHGQGGNSIVSFHAMAEFDGDKNAAALDLYEQFVHPIINKRTVRKWKRNLSKVPDHLKRLKSRGVTQRVIDQFLIGSDGERVTLPVTDEFDNVVNVRRWLPGARQYKMLNFTNRKRPDVNYGDRQMLFPFSALMRAREEGEPLFVVEGELDALALLSLGVFAVTSTHGAKSWPVEFNSHFRGLDVVLCYDNDEDGKVGSRRAAKHIGPYVKSLRVVQVPKIKMGDKQSKDVGDWLEAKPEMRARKAWISLADKAKPIAQNELVERKEKSGSVPLEDATDAAVRHGTELSVDAFVTGKTSDQFVVPTKYHVSCSGKCEVCPLNESVKPFRECTIDPVSEDALSVIGSTTKAVEKMMIHKANMPCEKECQTKVNVIDRVTVERLQVTPSLADRESKQYVTREVWSVSHKLVPHREHRFEGSLLTSPQDQTATLVFGKSSPLQTEVEAFEMTEKLGTSLRKFRARRPELKWVNQRINSQASWQSRNITRIVGRPEVHTAVDLVFHSVNEFEFDGDLVNRGMLDVLLLGDTRTGKNQVVEGLMKYYGLGEIASGENCSFAGLVGGCESLGRKFFVKWGVIPRNHERLVAIDESSALSHDDFGKLSRVRSEGIAEITKIVSERTVAKTRLIWLSNPRGGKPLSMYSYGVEAIRELVGHQEDVARFDLALTVASSEVDASAINTRREQKSSDADKYPADLCKSLILWAWSRTANQVVFTEGAIEQCLKSALELGAVYSSEIPLVQPENVRIKLAKIAAAVAARLFSTDDSYEQLIVEKCHVEYAVALMSRLYTKPSMAYDLYSQRAHLRTKLTDRVSLELAAIMAELGDSADDAKKALQSATVLTKRHLTEHLGDDAMAGELMRSLIKADCIAPIGSKDSYRKTPVLTAWLRKNK